LPVYIVLKAPADAVTVFLQHISLLFTSQTINRIGSGGFNCFKTNGHKSDYKSDKTNNKKYPPV